MLATVAYLRKNFPQSIVHQREVDNIFNMIFASDEKPLTARLRAVNDYGPNKVTYLQNTLTKIRSVLPDHQDSYCQGLRGSCHKQLLDMLLHRDQI